MAIDILHDSHGHEIHHRGDLCDVLPDPGALPDELAARHEEEALDLGLDDDDCLSSLRSHEPRAQEVLGSFIRWCWGSPDRAKKERLVRAAAQRFVIACTLIRPELTEGVSLTEVAQSFDVSRSNASLIHRRLSGELGGARVGGSKSRDGREHYRECQQGAWQKRRAAQQGRQLKPTKPKRPRYSIAQYRKLMSEAAPDDRAQMSTRPVTVAWKAYGKALADYERRLAKWRSARDAKRAAKAAPRKARIIRRKRA